MKELVAAGGAAPAAWKILAGLTVAEQALRVLPPSHKWASFCDAFVYSGDAVERGRLHTLVTANFCHGTVSHMVNNIVMLCAVGPVLEARWGGTRFTAAYLGAGAVGWLTSYALSRARTDAETWDAAAKWQEGYGCSPATYALAVTAAWALPPGTALGPWPDRWWSWASTAGAVYLLPHVLAGRWGETVRADAHQVVVAVALWSAASGHADLVPPVVGPVDWLAYYHLNTGLALARRALTSTLSSVPLTDHPSHFGGAIAGAALGAAVSPECHAPRAIAVVLAYLGARVVVGV